MAGDGDHVGAGVVECDGNGATEATAGPGDDGGRAGEF
jgi:hypothetical protein